MYNVLGSSVALLLSCTSTLTNVVAEVQINTNKVLFKGIVGHQRKIK
jgi:hypothetical protein